MNKQVKIILVKILNIFLVKLIFLPFEWVSCGVVDVVINYKKWVCLNLVPRAFPFSFCSVSVQDDSDVFIFKHQSNPVSRGFIRMTSKVVFALGNFVK